MKHSRRFGAFQRYRKQSNQTEQPPLSRMFAPSEIDALIYGDDNTSELMTRPVKSENSGERVTRPVKEELKDSEHWKSFPQRTVEKSVEKPFFDVTSF